MSDTGSNHNSDTSTSTRRIAGVARTTLPFPVMVFHSAKGVWHGNCVVELVSEKHIEESTKKVKETVVGLSLVNTAVEQGQLLATTPSWPFRKNRAYFPLRCFTYLYGDDESDDIEEAARLSPPPRFSGCLSSGLYCSRTNVMCTPKMENGDIVMDSKSGSRKDKAADPISQCLVSLLYLSALAFDNEDDSQDAKHSTSSFKVHLPLCNPVNDEKQLFIRCYRVADCAVLQQTVIDVLRGYYLNLYTEQHQSQPFFARTSRSSQEGSSPTGSRRSSPMLPPQNPPGALSATGGSNVFSLLMPAAYAVEYHSNSDSNNNSPRESISPPPQDTQHEVSPPPEPLEIVSERTEAFEHRTLYRHAMRRNFMLHFLRRLLLTASQKEQSLLLALWKNLPAQECMQNLLRSHRASGTLNNILTRIRTLVSLKKIRFMHDGFNLDLAHITPNIVAMGFPCTGSQAYMRNPVEEVLRWLEMYWNHNVWPVSLRSLEAFVTSDPSFNTLDKEAMVAYLFHPQPLRYRVYNLCSERCYQPSLFGGSFERFPSDDHNPPPLAQMFALCSSAAAFLTGNDQKDARSATRVGPIAAPTSPGSAILPDRLVAIHCKAGKGRTGVMIVALMLYLDMFDNLQAAMTHYNEKRTRDGKGITISSQIRFLGYFESCLKQIGRCLPADRPVRLRSVAFSPIPWFDMDGGCTPFLQIRRRVDNNTHHPLGQEECLSTENDTMVVIYDSRYVNGRSGPLQTLTSYVGSEEAVIRITTNLEVVNECQIVVLNAGGTLLHTEYMFSLWIHTSFLDDRGAVAMFGRDEVDGASKEHRGFVDPGFIVEVEYTALSHVP